MNEYLDYILTYLYDCELDNTEPQLRLIPTKSEDENDGGDSSSKCVSQRDMIEICKHGEHPRVSALNNSYGLRAKRDLQKYTVLGQYCGVEYLSDEFDNVYGYTAVGDTKNIYAFNLNVTMPIKPKNYKSNNDDEDEWNEEKYTVVIDAFVDREKRSLLTYINDCRKNILDITKTEEDKEHENVKFVTVQVDGWPRMFPVLIKDVSKGTELLAYYGNEYGASIKDKKRASDNRKETQRRIDDVLQGRISVMDKYDLTHD